MLHKVKVRKGILTWMAVSLFFAACSRENTLTPHDGGYDGGEFVNLSVGVSALESPDTRGAVMNIFEKLVNNVIIVVVGNDDKVVTVAHWEGGFQGKIKDLPAAKFPIRIFTFANLDGMASSTTAWVLADKEGSQLDQLAYEVKTLQELQTWKIKHLAFTALRYSNGSLPKTGVQTLQLNQVSSSLTLAVENRVARVDVIAPASSGVTLQRVFLKPRVEACGIANDATGQVTSNKVIEFTPYSPYPSSVSFYMLARSPLSETTVAEDIQVLQSDGKSYYLAMPTVVKNNYRYGVVAQDPNASRDYTFRTLFSSTKAKPIHFVIIGDAFTLQDNRVGGVYDKAVEKIVADFFSREPFKAYKEYFSVHQVYADSKKNGAKDTPSAVNGDTKFGASFGYMGVDRALSLTALPQDINKYLYLPLGGNKKPFLSLALVNDSRYGGIGGGLAVISMHPDAVNAIAVHELGHKFNLGDEYVDPSVPQPDPIAPAGDFANLSATPNRDRVQWRHFFTYPDYNDEVGIYEGGNYLARGVWRSSPTSIMRDLTVKYFNAVSRESIVKVIMEQASEKYSPTNFLKKDVLIKDQVFTRSSSVVGVKKDSIPLSPIRY